jgi:hypothetical protein
MEKNLQKNNSNSMRKDEVVTRQFLRRGYDIVRGNFFVNESDIIGRQSCATFDNFGDYYNYLNGDIYDNACYYKYSFSSEEIATYSIDLNKINSRSFIDYTIDDFCLGFSQDDLDKYKQVERKKEELIKWLKKFDDCNNYSDFIKMLCRYRKSEAYCGDEFILYNFIKLDKERALPIIMQFINKNYTIDEKLSVYFLKGLCLVYDHQKLLSLYNIAYFNYTERTVKKHIKKFEEFIELFEKYDISYWYNSYFDENTHFFVYCREACTEMQYGIDRLGEFKLYFETLEELAEYLHGDLTACDLSKAIMPNVDFSKYKITDKTILPMQYQKDITYTISKKYIREKNYKENKFTKDGFIVEQEWKNDMGKVIKSYKNTFDYFFDFVYFLKNDLSQADLLLCDGLDNIDDFSGINIDGAKLQSKVLDKIGVSYKLVAANYSPEGFLEIQNNEDETNNALMLDRQPLDNDESRKCEQIYYISDLHLLHRLQNKNCRSKEDIIYTIQKLIYELLDSLTYYSILLIGGDTSSNFKIFEMFVTLLRNAIDEMYCGRVKVIFTLGNHELWDFSNCSFENIVAKYEKLIIDNNMYLLQNNIVYKYDINNIGVISTHDLETMTKDEINDRLRRARAIIFGGLGFSAYNEKFNANQGIYRQTINREQEITEGKKFEKLYDKVCDELSNKKVIIFTHTPQQDWCAQNEPHKGFVYVNGHTHSNYFYDDGDYRIYADNQIGYKNVKATSKYFYVDDEYDIFTDYVDGIYEITKEEYIDFMRGKNIRMELKRDLLKIYMLKKSGYYCFLALSYSKRLSILYGGAMKRVEREDVNYCYNNMDKEIAYLKTPLDEFTNYQQQIADKIKSIGGDGKIHGSIVDINFFNHIYVNPLDYKITAYWASDVIKKIVFPDIKTLLQENCPELYLNYLKLIEDSPNNLDVLRNSVHNDLADQYYFYDNTDIYKASLEINKMQRLHSNILSTWHELPVKKINDKN